MLKILIVDDEFLVRVGLESTIPWHEYGFDVVGSARNGREAIPLFEKYDPDVLLTDIRMPVMGGLELIETLKKVKPSLVAIIISHYDDFNYAQKALKLGANDYILKSDLSPDNLMKIINRHVGNRNFVNSPPPVEDTETLYEDFLSEDNYLSIQNKCANIIADKSFVALIIKLYNKTKNEGRQSNIDLIKAFQNISSNIPSGRMLYKSFFSQNNEVLFVFSSLDMKADKLLEYLNLMRANLKQYLDIGTTMGISSVFFSEQELKKAIEEAYQSLDLAFFEPTGIKMFSHISDSQTDLSYFSISTASLKHSVSTGDNESISSNIEKILLQLENEKNLKQTKRLYTELMDYANDIATEQNLGKTYEQDFDDFQGFEALSSYITSLFNQLLKPKTPTYSFIISKCIKFIEDNYSNNINLSDLAKFTHKSKSYLSTLFKLETSVNFSIFLINYRIEKAKQLLLESDCMVYEIADQVGFNNPYYFSKVFKDTTGISCKMYRDRNFQGGANQ